MTVRILTATALILAGSWIPGALTGVQAATLAVPADHPSLAAAFAAARSGDRIEVSPGIYSENHLVLPNGVALVGVGLNPSEVIIDGGGRGRILLAESVGIASRVVNITFSNGRAAGHASYERSGGAIFCSNSDLTISNCIFKDNTSDGDGGAIRYNNSSPMLIGCVFENNKATSGGGGAIDCSFDSSPLIRSCEFRGNTAAWGGALSCRGSSSPTVFAATFAANRAVGNKGYGGAVFADLGSTPVFRQSTYDGNAARYGGAFACLSDSETNLINCTVTANGAVVLGGGMFLYDASPRIENSIVSFHIGTGITTAAGAEPRISCSDIFGNSRGDWVGGIALQLDLGQNIMADPLFCSDFAEGVSPYALTENSPCGASDLPCGYMGAWPIGCDAVGTTVSEFNGQWNDQDAELSWQARTFGSGTPQFRVTGMVAGDTVTVWEVPSQDMGGGFYTAVDPDRDAGNGDTFIYRLYLAEDASDWALVNEFTLVSVEGEAEEEEEEEEEDIELPTYAGIRDFKATPNPFNPMTTISFSLGQEQRARLAIFSPDGRRIAVLADRHFGLGEQAQIWDGRDAQGSAVSSGTYIVVIEGETARQTQKITLLK